MSAAVEASKIPTRPRWRRIAVITLLVLAAIAWGGYSWVTAKAASTLHDRLAQRGVDLHYSHQSWSPWKGLTLEDASLRRNTGGHEPLVDLSHLHVDVLWGESWAARSAVTRWRTEDAALTLHDAEGPIALKHFGVDFVLREGEIELARVQTNDGTLAFDLSGKILSPPSSPTEKRDLAFDLTSVRAVLSSLNFKPGTGPFTVKGKFSLNSRVSPVAWQADLTGDGAKTEWRGVPLEQAHLAGRVDNDGLSIKTELHFPKGSGKIDMARDGWEHKPLILSGTLTDSIGQTDEFNGNNQGATDVLTVSEISGSANLQELLGNLPSLAAKMPASVKIQTFPDLIAKDFVWHSGDDSGEWSLASLQLRKAATIEVLIRDKPLTIDHLVGQASHEGKNWQFEKVKGRFLGGAFALDGSYDGRMLSKADVSLESVRLSRLEPWLGNVRDSLDGSDLSFTYHGTICAEPTRSTGKGTLQLTHAPVVHVPLLDQAYDLFPTLISHKDRGGVGEFDVAYSMNKGIATIDPFKARSESVTVTATGTVNLVKRRVEGRARANLRGVAGVATSPLSHLLTEMEVSGPLDDIRVSPISAGGAVKGLFTHTVGTAKGTVTGSAKLSSGVLREGLTLPFEALGLFDGDSK